MDFLLIFFEQNKIKKLKKWKVRMEDFDENLMVCFRF